jgi:hypothetical protein
MLISLLAYKTDKRTNRKTFLKFTACAVTTPFPKVILLFSFVLAFSALTTCLLSA